MVLKNWEYLLLIIHDTFNPIFLLLLFYFLFFTTQLDLYKEEFTYEKNDHEKAKRENTRLKTDVKQAKLLIEKLNKDSQSIRTSYKKLYTEKEQIIQQLRRLTHPSTNNNTTPVQKYTCTSSSSFSTNHNRPLFESYTLKPQRCNNEQWMDNNLQVNIDRYLDC